VGGALMFENALMQLLSENKTDFTKLISIFGLYFQIWDDYCNLCLEQVMSELSVGDG
jgi:geranylgeranyl diphosphate synthase type 3